MTAATVGIFVPLHTIASATTTGKQSVDLEVPTTWDPTPILKWKSPDWQDERGLIHQGSQCSLFRVKQTENEPRTFRWHPIERNRWLLRVQDPVFPQRIDEKIFEEKEIIGALQVYLSQSHPK